MEKYTILSEVGRGAFGIVWKAQNKETKEIVAIKQMLQEYETWDECINLRELKSLRKLQHPNIIKLKEVFRVKKQLSFVFEYVEKNIYKLYERAKEDGATQLTDATIKLIVYQIASALSYMHKHGYFHRDLKPENLLISPDNVVKLIDLGLAREIRARPPFTEYVSTRWYRAPEILLHSTNYNSPVDVFALACIMAELYLMKPLFNGSSELDQIQKVTSILGTPSKTDWPDGHILASQKHITFPQYPPIPLAQVIPNCPPDGLNLIQEMMRWDPQKRISVGKILTHPYFNGVELPDEIKNSTDVAPPAQQVSNHQPVDLHTFSSNTTTNNNNNNNNNNSNHLHQTSSQNLLKSAVYPQVQQSGNTYNTSSNSNNNNLSYSNRQPSPPPLSQFENSPFHKPQPSYQNHIHYQSSSPDQRYSQNYRSQTEMDGMRGNFETSKHQGFNNGYGNLSQSSIFTQKKNLDPIYEFISKDMRGIQNNQQSLGVNSNSNNNNNNPNRFGSISSQPMNQQASIGGSSQITSKSKLDDEMEEILGTYLPTPSKQIKGSSSISALPNTNTSMTRIRQPISNTSSSAMGGSLFGMNNLAASGSDGIGQSSSSIFSTIHQQPISRISAHRDPLSSFGAGGYVPSAATRSTGNDIYNFDGIKQQSTTSNSQLGNSSMMSSQLRQTNFDIYNFDNLIPQNNRKAQLN